MSYGIINGNQYIPCGKAVRALPPGLYRVEDPDFGPRNFRKAEVNSDELLDLHGTAADDIANDVRTFLAKKEEYVKYGFVHKRGIILYGPPGTGKTSIAQLAARRFVADGGIVVLANTPYDLPLATEMVAAYEPDRNLMVLLDDPNEGHLNDPRVLSVLDGTTPVKGLVTIVTTNYKSRLPPRLANRPGRFDRVVLVDRIESAVQVAFLQTVAARTPGGPCPAEEIVKTLEGVPITLAHLREAFLSHVVLGTPLPEIRARFEAMASTENDDDGRVAPSPKAAALFSLLSR